MVTIFDHLILFFSFFLLGLVLGYVMTTILIWGAKVRF
jgi:hypothetical protein